MVKFMPADLHLTETRQPLKDMYDEWLARVICYAFSVPASAFVSQVNRATSQTLRTQASQEGIVPLKSSVKMVMDRVIGGCFGEPDLEFCWVGDDAVDPLEQAQTISILVGAGVKTIAEARAELGLGQASGVVKFNPNHDEQGRFTTADNDGGPGAKDQFADNTAYSPTTTDAGSGGRREQVAQIDPMVPPDMAAPHPEPVTPVEPKQPQPTAPPESPNIGASETTQPSSKSPAS